MTNKIIVDKCIKKLFYEHKELNCKTKYSQGSKSNFLSGIGKFGTDFPHPGYTYCGCLPIASTCSEECSGSPHPAYNRSSRVGEGTVHPVSTASLWFPGLENLVPLGSRHGARTLFAVRKRPLGAGDHLKSCFV